MELLDILPFELVKTTLVHRGGGWKQCKTTSLEALTLFSWQLFQTVYLHAVPDNWKRQKVLLNFSPLFPAS